MELNRRDFLKGAGAIGALGAMGTLAACSPAAPKSEGANGGASSDGALTAQSATQKWSFEIPPEPIADADIAETFNADVVVVGAGMAGTCCAVSAAEGGLSVILIDAGTKAISRGGSNQAIGTKYQKEMGIDYTPKDALEHVKIEQLAGFYSMDKMKWSRWLQYSGESMDWMIDKMTAKGLRSISSLRTPILMVRWPRRRRCTTSGMTRIRWACSRVRRCALRRTPTRLRRIWGSRSTFRPAVCS